MARYWWVSVGGNPCEPAVVKGKQAWTFGCPDPFALDAIELVEEMSAPPDTPAEAKRKADAWERKRAKDAANGIFHGYRRF